MAEEPTYSLEELFELRTKATQLGFWNDATHWQNEIAKLRKEQRNG